MARSLASETAPPAPPGALWNAGRWRGVLIPCLSLLLLLALWQLAAGLAANPRLMPPPSLVLEKIAAETATGELPWNLGITLLRVAASFVLAMS